MALDAEEAPKVHTKEFHSRNFSPISGHRQICHFNNLKVAQRLNAFVTGAARRLDCGTA
jgi:hypothetical protein